MFNNIHVYYNIANYKMCIIVLSYSKLYICSWETGDPSPIFMRYLNMLSYPKSMYYP